MNFSFLSPFGISSSVAAGIFLGSLLLLGLLYFLRVSPTKRIIPYLHLWKKAVGHHPSRLRNFFRFLSFLVAVLIIVLLISSLWKPVWHLKKNQSHTVLIIDASASMKAILPNGKTRLEQAKEQATQFVSSFSEQDVSLVISLQESPHILGGYTHEALAVMKQIQAVEAMDTKANLTESLLLAERILQTKENPHIVLFSDGGFQQEELDSLSHHIQLNAIPIFYQPTHKAPPTESNIAITSFSAREYHQNRLQYEVFLKIESFSQQAQPTDAPSSKQSFTLEILQGGKLVKTETFSISPGEKIERTYRNLAGSGQKLEARLFFPQGHRDLLSADNQAFTVLPEVSRQQVILVTEGNLFLEGALLAISSGEENQILYQKQTPAEYEAHGPKTDSSIIQNKVFIFDCYTPSQAPQENAFYINPQGPQSPFRIVEKIKAPLLTDLNSKHPLARFLALKDINISNSSIFSVSKQDQVISSMLGKPIWVAKEVGTQAPSGQAPKKIVAIGFDFRKSDFPLRVAFPLLLLNTLDWFRQNGIEHQSYSTGHDYFISLFPKNTSWVENENTPSSIKIQTPKGTFMTIPLFGNIAFFHPQLSGFYEWILPKEWPTQKASILLASNLQDTWESQAISKSKLSIGSHQLKPLPQSSIPHQGTTLWGTFLLIVLAILFVEWWLYHRRWIV